MIDTENIRTASAYINNQLLSRGLIQDGQYIDFANPGKKEDVLTTMGRIMSVVNDLILRRDKDAEHRESLANTMRSVRAENQRHIKEIDSLTEKTTESRRKLALAESSERGLRTQLKSAEAAAKAQKEDIARQKALVVQTRAACATETRKRDRQIETLKKQLSEAGRARGARTNPAITTIQISGDASSAKGTPVKGATPRTRSGRVGGSSGGGGSETYSLRNETNAFLAKLSQNLNEENEAILGAMRQTMHQLRAMSGWESAVAADEHVTRHPSWDDMAPELDAILEHMKTILTNPSFVPIEEVVIRDEEIARLKHGWVKMEDRWQEAMQLIDGWRQRMLDSGRGVDEEDLMMGLRLSPVKIRDIAAPGQSMELSAIGEEEEEEGDEEDEEDDDDWMGARSESPCPSEPASLRLLPADHQTQSFHVPAAADAVPGADSSDPSFQVLAESAAASLQQSLGSSPLPEPPQLSPLRNSNTAGNRGIVQNRKLRKPNIDYASISEVAKSGGKRKEPDSPPEQAQQHQRAPKTRLPSGGRLPKHDTVTQEHQRSVSNTSLDEALLPQSPVKESAPHQPQKEQPTECTSESPAPAAKPLGMKDTPRRGVPKLSHPAEAPEPQQSPLTMSTIAAKLAASEKEAAAARVRAKLRAARAMRAGAKPDLEPPVEAHSPQPEPEPKKPTTAPAGQGAEELSGTGQEGEQREVKPEKRKRERRTSKAASRRRSTLSPLELQSLITGNVQ